MLTATVDKHRRAYSSSSYKSKRRPFEDIQMNLLNVYTTDKKMKQSRWKGKQNNKNKTLFQDNNFPNSVVKFKNTTKQAKRSDGQNVIMIDSNIKQVKRKKRMNFERIDKDMQNWTLNPDNYPINNSSLDNNSKKAKIRTNTIKQVYIKKYKQAIEKIFKGLDIFNRGTITETNINKWIPEQALYFLGDIFQKIRSQRLNLSNQQFLQQCLPIMYESSQDDIKHFLESVNGKDTAHNISIDFSQEQNSPVQMKISKDHKLGQYRRMNYKPLISYKQLTDIPQPIYSSPKIDIPQLKVTKEIPYFRNISPRKNTQQINKSQFQHFSISSNAVYRSKERGKNILQAPKSSSNEISDSSNQYTVPFFKFQLPKQQIAYQKPIIDIKIHQSSQSNKKELNQCYNLQFTYKQDENISLKPKTSRIVHQNIHNEPLINHKRQFTYNNNKDEKINKLTSRLQSIIKLNNQKIDNNKKFIRENSAPRA